MKTIIIIGIFLNIISMLIDFIYTYRKGNDITVSGVMMCLIGTVIPYFYFIVIFIVIVDEFTPTFSSILNTTIIKGKRR